MSPRRSRTRALAVAALFAVCVGVALHLTGALGGLERESVSTRFALRDEARPTEVVVVGIDVVTFDVLRLLWPLGSSP